MKTKLIATAAAGAAALTTLGLGAGTAQAAPAGGIAPGKYWFHSPGYFGAVNHDPAVVRGGVLSVRYGPIVNHYRIIKTPRGGYTDNGLGNRMTFTKKGNRWYAGEIYYYGIPGGKISLTKR
ncbi:hypothetical protein [Gordonia paraffinivorans]|uniref:hypothetical protein n=1 Tax=Gordonia paraffinivorans TaxID=175628 RepID=UPI001E5DD25A|nr:hypothetical protein [Gordonia paraffinivorans]MCD2143715.1 hypothetical protein [Gordonia paraffinivorans]